MRSPGRWMRAAVEKFLGPRKKEKVEVRFEDMNRAMRRGNGYHVRRYATRPMARTSRIDRRIGGRLNRRNATEARTQSGLAEVKKAIAVFEEWTN